MTTSALRLNRHSPFLATSPEKVAAHLRVNPDLALEAIKSLRRLGACRTWGLSAAVWPPQARQPPELTMHSLQVACLCDSRLRKGAGAR